MDRDRILYSVDILNAVCLGERIPHSQQSDGATRLLERLGGSTQRAGARSRSHSRAAVAAALAEASQINLGIDIEWMAEDRPFAAMAELFMTRVPPRIGCTQFYRGWTFYESYYKAFQSHPDDHAIARVMAAADDHGTLNLEDGVRVIQRNIIGAFRLCLVWSVSTGGNALPRGAEIIAVAYGVPAN